MFYSKTIPMSIVPSLNFRIGETSFRNLNKQQASFMWYQSLIKVLKCIPPAPILRNDLLTECRLEHSNNNTELGKIQEFEDTYDSDNVIAWYTRDTFLYRLLNKALRTKDIVVIYKFRFVLINLHDRLAQLHGTYIDSLKSQNLITPEIIVFHGQGLTLTELQNLKDNTNGRVSMNSFLFASTSSEIALLSAGDGSGRPIIESVFFEIHCSIKSYFAKPFVNIQQYSYLKTKDEILFTIGTMFHIDAVEKLTEQIWHVKFTLCNDEDDLIPNELVDSLKSNIGNAFEISTFTDLSLNTNEIGKAIDFYDMILKDLPFDHCNRINIKQNIGKIHLFEGNYSAALKCFKQAMRINRKVKPQDFSSISSIINNIGSVYKELGNYSQSIKYYRKALRIQKTNLGDSDPELATTFNNLGIIHMCLSNYSLALKYHEKAKQIRISCFSETHPDLGKTFDNIGETYFLEGCFNSARTNFEKSLDIKLKSLDNDHPSLANTYRSLGHIYGHNNNCEKALEYYQKSLDISLKAIQNNQPDSVRIYSNIAQCYRGLGHFTTALFYHKKALKIRLKSLPNNHSDTIISYIHIGSLYIYMEKYKLARKYLKKGMAQSSSSTNKELLSCIYHELGTLYAEKSNSGMAVKYYKRAISLELKLNEPSTIPNLAMIYISLGHFYLANDDTTNALIQFEKALEIGEKCLEFDDTAIRLVLPTIVTIFEIKKDYVTALKYMTRFLKILQKDPTTTLDDLATTYFNIGYINYCKHNNKKAILNYRTAMRYASSTNPNIGQLYYGLALIYDEQKDLNVALWNYKNALQFFSNSDDYLASTYNNIGAIYCLMHDNKKALYNYFKALTIIDIDNELVPILYYNIAFIDDIKNDYVAALDFYKNTLETMVEHEIENENLLIKIYNNMGRIYNQVSNYNDELNCYRKVLKLELNSNKISENHEAIATTYSNLGIIYFRQCNYSSAVRRFEKALEIASKSLADDHPHIAEYRDYIALTKKHLQSKGTENA